MMARIKSRPPVHRLLPISPPAACLASNLPSGSPPTSVGLEFIVGEEKGLKGPESGATGRRPAEEHRERFAADILRRGSAGGGRCGPGGGGYGGRRESSRRS
ncbi:hypothetical protein Mp_1g29170 [Marchantia polymorpha subsp. ruderalis]|uniref:Uncharacterized protein n=2 Tax=Marchantia polymorpha TaxID=3197 RepID=A0AAF6AVG6_MARPO|nr:hypothetical protein MARPO_0107s0032 [Marchantia polymorpha]BBN00437.1 hypothetical protein Mp_1g29170 [Marchantia polymorpha subsp. ruderalis]|eukprot:PTQ31765.1 hypothetical protein MARPO_0107s0032 [Marchantia polymorpha]